jgi:hypothetical protein
MKKIEKIGYVTLKKLEYVPYIVELHPNVARHVALLHSTGLFGETAAQTIERLVCDWILSNSQGFAPKEKKAARRK